MRIFGLVHCYIYSYMYLGFFFIVVGGLSSHSRIFPSYGDVTITGEGLNILTYARHSLPLSREGRTTEIPEKLYMVSSCSKYCGATIQRY